MDAKADGGRFDSLPPIRALLPERPNDEIAVVEKLELVVFLNYELQTVGRLRCEWTYSNSTLFSECLNQIEF